MGSLFDAKTKIESIIVERKLERSLTLGKIGLKAGFMLAFVKQDTPDDAEKLNKLRLAAQEVLGTTI
ncbi:MAG: hypothetical protein WDO69_10290 [Pseudomonadota bacterium]